MIKLFKKKSEDTGNIDSWVFEKDIEKTFMEEFDKRSKRIETLVYVCLASMVLILFFSCFYYYKSIFKAVKMVLYPIVIGSLGAHLLLKVLSWLGKRKFVKKYWPIVVIPAIVLAATIVVIKMYPDNGGILHRADILGFSGDFLSFVGAFCLGYFIYTQDCERRIEEKRSKVRLLLDQIKKADQELLRLSRLCRYKNRHQLSANQITVKPIPFDPNWQSYYLEYEALKGRDTELEDTVAAFFDNICRINIAIEKGKIESAVKINECYIDRLNYSIQRYNELEAISCLMAACNDSDFLDTKSWLERKEVIDLINELCRKYYLLIENYVYSWLLKHNLSTTTEENDLNREITDWLLNSPEIRKIIRYPNDRRIISRVVFDCSCKFSSQSKNVNYVWGEYSLR